MATLLGQYHPTLQVEYLTRALLEAAHRELEHQKLLQVFMERCSKAEAGVQRLEELCRGLKTNAEMWESKYHHEISNKKTVEEHLRCEERSRAMAEKARLEEKMDLDAKHVEPAAPPVTVEHIHIEFLQTENAEMLERLERLEEELNSATETLQHVTATVLALVAEVEKSQSGEMFARHMKMKVGRPTEVSTHLDSTSSNIFERNKLAFHESIRRAEALLIDATWVWKRAQSEAECMLIVGRRTILDKILGRVQ